MATIRLKAWSAGIGRDLVPGEPARVVRLVEVARDAGAGRGDDEVADVEVIVRGHALPLGDAVDVDIDRAWRGGVEFECRDARLLARLAEGDEFGVHLSRLAVPSRLQPQVETPMVHEQHPRAVVRDDEGTARDVRGQVRARERVVVAGDECTNRGEVRILAHIDR